MASDMTGQRILLTGASGFIGHHLLKRLLQLGVEVFAAGRKPPMPLGGTDASPVKFLQCDFADEATLEPHRETLLQMDRVVHLGSLVLRSSNPADDDCVLSMRVNAEGTASLLRHLAPSLAGFCYVSTLDIYGPPQSLPVTEDHATRPASYYGASKLAAEAIMRVFAERSQVPVTVLRLSQVYGPGDNSRKAIPNFIRNALRGEAPIIYGDGSDERDYVYVADIVAAIELSLSGCVPGTFNIAGGRGCSIREVATAIVRLTGSTAVPIWKPRATPATRIVLDIGRAERQLGYHPQVNLEEGLCHTVDWFRQNTAVV